MPFVREVGVIKKTIATPTPTREQMEKLINTGKKRKTSDKTTDLKKFFKEQEEKSQTFFSELRRKSREGKGQETLNGFIQNGQSKINRQFSFCVFNVHFLY